MSFILVQETQQIEEHTKYQRKLWTLMFRHQKQWAGASCFMMIKVQVEVQGHGAVFQGNLASAA